MRKRRLDNCAIPFKLMIYKRYIGDIFVLSSFKVQHQRFVDYIKKQYICLKFTSEAENDNSFSFLDIKITHHNQQFNVYRKPTFSGAFTHYESFLDKTYKKSLIHTLLFCCFSICSDYTLFHLEVENLREILKKNSCPSGIIQESHVPKKVISSVPKKELFIVLPYLGTMSSNLKQRLRTCFKNSLPQCNIKIIVKSRNRLSSLFFLKMLFLRKYSLT